jgi:plastocyanin
MLLSRKKSVLVGMVIMLLSGFPVACQSRPPLATPSAPGISVGITGEECPNVVVQVGQQVTWTNQDSQERVVRDEPAEGNIQFDSGTLQPGDTFTFTFPQAGSYTYTCSLDGSLTGGVTVEP